MQQCDIVSACGGLSQDMGAEKVHWYLYLRALAQLALHNRFPLIRAKCSVPPRQVPVSPPSLALPKTLRPTTAALEGGQWLGGRPPMPPRRLPRRHTVGV